jgi:heme A synthase
VTRFQKLAALTVATTFALLLFGSIVSATDAAVADASTS